MSRGFALANHQVFPPPAAVSPTGSISAPSQPGIESHDRVDGPRAALGLGACLTLLLMAMSLGNAAGLGKALENLHVLVAAAVATTAIAMMSRRPGPAMLRYRQLAISLALAGLGMVSVELTPLIGETPAVVLANVAFVAGSVMATAAIFPALYRLLEGSNAASAGLDGGIMLAAGTTLLVTLWGTRPDAAQEPVDFVMPILASTLVASAGAAAIVAFSMRIAPAVRGIWCGIAGVSILGLCWVVWIDRSLHGQPRDGAVSSFFSVGVLVLAYGWMTWNMDVGRGERYARLARSLADWLPIVAILLCVVLAAVPHGRVAGVDPAPFGTAAVVLLTIARQRLLILSERLASRRLAGEVEERAQTMLSLGRLEQAESLEATALSICDEALRLDAIKAAGVYVFGPSGSVVPLALRGACRPMECVGESIDDRRALHLRACAGEGTWVETPCADGQHPVMPLVGEAFAPMRWDDRIVGVVAMGTTSREGARLLPERLSTLTEFGVVSAALMGPLLSDRWRLADLRGQLERVIEDHAFTPVFQPVVRLADGHPVGHEALTRFADGTRPDKRFMEAHSAGMSVRLEMACLGDQLEAASWLPEGQWVSLNVSPALVSAVVPLVSALERADRDVVLEITEHVEIGDYRSLAAALDLVRGHARLAVDDAGAGYAGLRHILELNPAFVKLDLSLVRNVDKDPARQAMVAGMAHFAANSACELIAEGIETPEELAELIRLGVPLGQGYLFGKPGPIA